MTEYVPKPSWEEIENLTLDELKYPLPLKRYLDTLSSLEAEDYIRGYKAGIRNNAHSQIFYIGYHFGMFHNRPYEIE